MRIYIATETPVAEPGYYTTFKDKDYLDYLISQLKNDRSWLLRFDNPMIPVFKTVKRYLEPNKFIRVANPETSKILSQDNYEPILRKSIVTNCGDIIRSGLSFNDPIFNGYLKSRDHIETLIKLLPGDDVRVCITHYKNLMALDSDVRRPGIYITDPSNEKKIREIKNYSVLVWQELCSAVFSTFSNLGAKKIVINDETNLSAKANINISEKVLNKLSLDLGFSMNRTEKFDLTYELEPTIDVEEAKRFIEQLRAAPQLYQIANHTLLNRKSKSISQAINVDISFGLNFNALPYLQGSFAGGHNRNLKINIDF